MYFVTLFALQSDGIFAIFHGSFSFIGEFVLMFIVRGHSIHSRKMILIIDDERFSAVFPQVLPVTVYRRQVYGWLLCSPLWCVLRLV